MLNITDDEIKKFLLSSILGILIGILITCISLASDVARYDKLEDVKAKYMNGQYTSKVNGDIFISDDGGIYVYIPVADKVYHVESK